MTHLDGKPPIGWKRSATNNTRPNEVTSKIIAGLSSMSAVAGAQTNAPVRSLMKATDAAQRMTADQARETEAYTLGVQTVLWGMQWVKAGQTLRAMSSLALAAQLGMQDVSTAGINVWTHYQSLLTHKDRIWKFASATSRRLGHGRWSEKGRGLPTAIRSRIFSAARLSQVA